MVAEREESGRRSRHIAALVASPQRQSSTLLGSPQLRKARNRGARLNLHGSGSVARDLGRRGSCRITIRDLLGEACLSTSASQGHVSPAGHAGKELLSSFSAAPISVADGLKAWQAFCSCVSQDLAIGRSVSLGPLGSFYRASALAGEAGVAFRCCEKLIWEHGVRVEGADASPQGLPSGPATRVRPERVAEALGWPRRRTEEVLEAVLERAAARLGGPGPDVSLDFPGLGTLTSCEKQLKFEADPSALGTLPAGGLQRRPTSTGSSRPVTVGHTMFAAAGTDLLKQTPSAASMRLLALPQLDQRRGGESPARSGASTPAGREGRFLSKSSSAPQLLAAAPAGVSLGGEPQLAGGPESLQAVLRRTMPVNLRASKGRRSLALLPAPAVVEAPSSAMPFTRSAPSRDQVFPPLFDTSSRTRAALFRSQADGYRASDVIGSNYSPVAAPLQVDFSAGEDAHFAVVRVRDIGAQPLGGRAQDARAIDWVSQCPTIPDGSALDVELRAAGLDQEAFCRALCRYAHYVDQGVPEDVQAPFKQPWLDHAATLLDLDNPSRWTGVLLEQRRRILREARQEVLADYLKADRTAIVNYALLDGRCRDRLDLPLVPVPPREWGSVAFTVPDIGTSGGPRKEWRGSIAAGKASLLACSVQNSRTALRLQAFWLQECAEVRLLLCPERHAEPVDIFAFQSAQASQLDLACQTICGAWREVTRIISEEPLYLSSNPSSIIASFSRGRRAAISGEPPLRISGEAALAAVPHRQLQTRFLEAVSAQLSLLLRGAVERSLAEYGDLFERYAGEPWHYTSPEAETEGETQNELIVNKLVVCQDEGGCPQIRFLHDLPKLASKLLQPYRECARSLRDLPRPSVLARGNIWRASLPVVSEEEDHIRRGFERIEEIVDRNLASAEEALELYQPFLFLLEEEVCVEEFIDDRSKTREDYAAYVRELRETLAELQERCPLRMHMQMMRVEAGDVNLRLVQCGQDCISRLLSSATVRNKDHSARLVMSFEALQIRVSRTPNTEEQLVEVETALQDAMQRELPLLKQEYEDIKAWLFFAFDHDHLLREEDYGAIHRATEWQDFGKFLEAREASLRQDRQGLEEKLGGQSRRVIEDLGTCRARIAKFKDKASVRLVEDYLDQIAGLEKHLAGTAQAVAEVQRREELLGYEAAEIEELDMARSALEPFKNLWTLVREHQQASALWTKSPLFGAQLGFEVDKVQEQAASMHCRAKELKAHFQQEDVVRPGNVAKKLVSELELLQDSLPLLRAVCNPALEERHWREIYNVLGFSLERDHALTLQKLLDMDFASFLSEICEISETATKEREVEAGLDAQLQEWEAGVLHFEESATTGTASVSSRSFEEVQALLDRHLVRTQTLRRSPFAGLFRARIDNWESFLTEAQSAVHQWQKVQAVWLDLEPIMMEEEGASGRTTEGGLSISVEPQEQEAELFKEAAQILHRRVRDCRRAPGLVHVFREDNLLRDLQDAGASLTALRDRLGPGLN